MLRLLISPFLPLFFSLPALAAVPAQEQASGSAGQASVSTGQAEEQLPLGKLVIVGGGGTLEPIQKAALMLTGKEQPRVLVLPQASGAENRGLPSVEMWQKAGAGTVINLGDLSDGKRARREIKQADFVWFPGGSQARLLDSLEKAELTGAIRERFRQGGVIGGTSAGAAIMGDSVIQGAPEPMAMRKGAMQPRPGLGLLPGTIVDQHFTARNRQARLLTAVLDSPDQLGVGIDERTAIVVDGKQLLVLGEGHVIVYDARDSTVETPDADARQGARNVRMHLLREGMEWTR